MKIGELAERAGVSAKTVRYYESIGLLAEPERTTSNYRDYGADAVDRLRFIRDSQAAGLTLAEVGSILEMKDAGSRRAVTRATSSTATSPTSTPRSRRSRPSASRWRRSPSGRTASTRARAPTPTAAR